MFKIFAFHIILTELILVGFNFVLAHGRIRTCLSPSVFDSLNFLSTCEMV